MDPNKNNTPEEKTPKKKSKREIIIGNLVKAVKDGDIERQNRYRNQLKGLKK